MLNNDGKIGDDYVHDYMPRTDSNCPYCEHEGQRTNRYLFRCTNYEECGRYW